jgi:hypothetical protein
MWAISVANLCQSACRLKLEIGSVHSPVVLIIIIINPCKPYSPVVFIRKFD